MKTDANEARKNAKWRSSVKIYGTFFIAFAILLSVRCWPRFNSNMK
jgi:hypothetical protein